MCNANKSISFITLFDTFSHHMFYLYSRASFILDYDQNPLFLQA